MGEMNYNDMSARHQQRDLVLSINEFCYLQNKTDGTIKSYVGPLTMTISQQETLVIFDTRTKKFIETNDFERAKQLFVSSPEGWYTILKNPAEDNQHPDTGRATIGPATIKVGTKINIPGPTSFALFPGQMAKVVRGHRLRSNQYLIARVYDAEAAKKNNEAATMIDAEGNAVANTKVDYFMGQLLVIKGTEMSFYIPPTGIEVIPIDDKGKEYVRDAVTLERLEYAILKDEDGEKRYVHGPAVVFPKPTETFVETPKGGTIFRALELSPISGIYIKVIANYTDEKGVKHPTGEELFITGNDQMIYYPRPEHAMIQYDGKYMHHAIAIPKGEGRYILNRLTGDITTVIGPRMYLPDPRTEIVVKRKLTTTECKLFYPNNQAVLDYNEALSERATERAANKGLVTDSLSNAINATYSVANQASTLAIFEANANISRGVSYTKPRTITLDTKFDGVVEVNVWTGYAVNVISKSGKKEVVVGPKSRLLDYDETLEQLTLSTGKPKTDGRVLKTVYLNISNNRVSDIATVITKDGAEIEIGLCYNVSFLPKYQDKWFTVENYTKFLSNSMRSILAQKVKNYNIDEFSANTEAIIRKIVLDTKEDNKNGGRLFAENGMIIDDVELTSVKYVDSDIEYAIERHQNEMLEKTIKLADVKERLRLTEEIAAADKKTAETKHQAKLYALELESQYENEEFQKNEELKALKRASDKAAEDAKLELQSVIDEIEKHRLERAKADDEAALASKKAQNEIEAAREKAKADAIKDVITAISPELTAALTTMGNANILESATKNLSPYTIAKGQSVSETLSELLRGTTLEDVLKKINY